MQCNVMLCMYVCMYVCRCGHASLLSFPSSGRCHLCWCSLASCGRASSQGSSGAYGCSTLWSKDSKMTLQKLKEILRKQLKRHLQCGYDPTTIRAWSENDPRMKPSVRHPARKWGYFSCSPRAFSIEKYNISPSGYHSKFHPMLPLARKVTFQHRQILHLPQKVALELHQ